MTIAIRFSANEDRARPTGRAGQWTEIPPGDMQEVVIAGRRYRLVPIGSGPVPPPPKEAAPVGGPPGQRGAPLTKREREIAALVSEGCVNKEVAARLGISEWTVSTHLRRIFAKLGVDRRAAMVSRLHSDALAALGAPEGGASVAG